MAQSGLLPLSTPLVGGAEEQFRWLVEHSPVAMCVHVDGRYVYVNRTLMRKMAARSADQLLGRKISEFVHPDSLVAVRAQIASRQHDGDMSPPLEMAIVTLEGATRHVEAMAVRTLWEGRPAHKVVFRDVSEQKATEAAAALPGGLGRPRQRRHHLHHYDRLCDQLESRGRGDLSPIGGRRAGYADQRGRRRGYRSCGDRGRRGSGERHPPGRRRVGARGAGVGVPDERWIRGVVRATRRRCGAPSSCAR